MKPIFSRRRVLTLAVALTIFIASTVGGTIAWFTDSVTSGSNIIKSGTLDVEMYWADGKADPTAEATVWKDASTGAIFDYANWEPGYTDMRHIRIKNAGSLAFKYQLDIEHSSHATYKLNDVIDVYYIPGGKNITNRSDLSDAYKVGTLSDLIAETDGAAHGVLLPAGEASDEAPSGEITATIALKMQESAGNEYQGIGAGPKYAVKLLASQYTYEDDSFDASYDADSDTIPVASSDELEDAIKNGQPVMLMEDVSISGITTITNKEISIELAGNELSFDNDNASYLIAENSIVNITDSTGKGSVKLNAEKLLDEMGRQYNSPLYAAGENSVINFDNINLEVTGANSAAISALNGGTINMNGGTISVNEGCAIFLDKGTFNMNGGSITLKDGSKAAVIVYETDKGSHTDQVINLNGGNVTSESNSIPVIHIERYGMTVTTKNSFNATGLTLYTKSGSANGTITVNGTQQ